MQPLNTRVARLGPMPLDRSAAFTCLLEVSQAFRRTQANRAAGIISAFLEDFYGQPRADRLEMYPYAERWAAANLEAPRAGWARCSTYRCLGCSVVSVAGGDLAECGCPLCGHRLTVAETVLVHEDGGT